MIVETQHDLLLRADEAYKGVVLDPATFGPRAAELVEEAGRSGHAEALVVALRAAAWARRAGFANADAKRLLNEAARVARRHALERRLAEVLVTRGAVNLELGAVGAAQRDLDHAAGLLGQRRSAELDLQRAVLHHNRGRLAEAAAGYRQALSWTETPNEIRAKVANNLAIVEVQRGQLDAARRTLDVAAELADASGPALVAVVASTRAWATVQGGQPTEGLRRLHAAAQLYEAAGLSPGEHLIEHVDALADLRLVPEAQETIGLAIRHLETGGVTLMEAEARLRAARLALLAGDHASAAREASTAARHFRQQRRSSWASVATLVEVDARAGAGGVSGSDLMAARRAAGLLERRGMVFSAVEGHLIAGRVALGLQRPPMARSSLRRAEVLASRGPVLVRLKGYVAGALVAQIEHDRRAVLRRCRAGLVDLQRHRAALGSSELRALASGHGTQLGELGLRALLHDGSAAQVFEWLERTRAASLLLVDQPSTEGLDDELMELRTVTDALSQARRDGQGEPADLVARQLAIESRIRRLTWERHASPEAAGAAVGVREIRPLLDGRVLVEYGVLDGQGFAVVVDAARARLVDLGAVTSVGADGRALLFALRRLARPRSATMSASAGDSAREALQRLHDALIRPLDLPPGGEVVVAPPPEWHQLSWAALHDGPVTLVPSASMWLRSRACEPPPAGDVVVVAGPDLPGALIEAEALRRIHPRARILTPPASTVSAVTAALSTARLAHLACHGLLRADNPLFSSLRLSDGSLSVHEMDLRGIAPHRMILASCDSAADVGFEGNEMVGFVSALMSRGTAGLLASAVTVADGRAAPLMSAVHAAVVDGATLASALHRARRDIDPREPAELATWAAFNAFGAA
jgi:tetratricopeptide (TPR) repeat protein